jgi:hypothetical protein
MELEGKYMFGVFLLVIVAAALTGIIGEWELSNFGHPVFESPYNP